MSLIFLVGLEYDLVSVADTVQFKWTTSKDDYIVIGVQASQEAHIILTDTYWDTTNSYTVILGYMSNTQTVIKNGTGFDDIIEETVGILSVYEIRYFWISWEGQVELFYYQIFKTCKKFRHIKSELKIAAHFYYFLMILQRHK